MEPLIRVQNLMKIYNPGENEVRALDDVSLDIGQGEFVAIIGQSGSGKSTFMNMLGCLDVPTSGHYFLNGKDVSSLSDDELSEIRNQEIGFIFQGFNLIQNLTALENVELPLIYRNVPAAERRRLSEESLKRVGLEKRMDHKPTEMSGGQQQRVAIARALVNDPEIVLADEPTGALDTETGIQIMELLKSLQVNEGKSIILITHNMGLVAEMADEVCVMYMGRVVEFGSLEDIFDHTSHPYTKALLRSVPVLGLGDNQKLETIPGVTPNPVDLKEGCEFADRCSECMEKCRRGKIPTFEVSIGHKVRCLKYDSYPEVK